MFAFLCKQTLVRRTGSPLNIGISATTQLSLLPIISFSSGTTSSKEDKNFKNQEPFTLSYLVNTCGLSPEIAIPKSQSLHFESSERPDSILTLLREHGFDNTHISKLISRYPLLLLADPEKTLFPKLKFYLSIGASSDDLASNPSLLKYSLDNRILPCYHFLKSILISDKKVLSVLIRLSWDVRKNLGPNVALLKQVGVPQPLISSLLYKSPKTLDQNSERFTQSVKEILELEFNPSKVYFIQALYACRVNKSVWEHKKEVYKRYGWSDDQFWLAFKKDPKCMIISEKKIESGMDFLVNKMSFPSTAIARNPIVLVYSLEKRIIPRFSVIRALQLKGLMKKNLSLTIIVCPTDERFVDIFVTKYQKQLPQLLSIYQGKFLS